MAETYNTQQAAGRKKLADALVAAVLRAGGKAEISTNRHTERSLWVEISTDHYAATIWINGERRKQETFFVIPWHAKSDAPRLSSMFGFTAGGPVNQYHDQKCTAVADDATALLERVPAAIRMLVSGEAFA